MDACKRDYSITDLGPIKHCLGWEIFRDRKRRFLSINQRQYAKEILQRFGMQDATPVSTPACPSIDFSKAMCPTTTHDKTLMADVPYLEALGSLLYLAMCTRPDIAFAVSELAKFASNPGYIHWTGVKRIMRYLRGTLDYGLLRESYTNIYIGLSFSPSYWDRWFKTRKIN